MQTTAEKLAAIKARIAKIDDPQPPMAPGQRARSNMDAIDRPMSQVYFIQIGQSGPIKIGISSNVGQRFTDLSVACPWDLRLLCTKYGTEKDERRLHQRFAADRMRGEWFRPSARLLAFIGEILKKPAEDPGLVWLRLAGIDAGEALSGDA
jgi:hypothetical protein